MMPGLEIGVRPEHIKLVAGDASDHKAAFPIRIDKISDVGRYRIIDAGMADQTIAPVQNLSPRTPRNPALTTRDFRAGVHPCLRRRLVTFAAARRRR